jgi:hypothetical protein
MKNAVFCDVLLLLVTANVLPSSPILVALMIEAIHPTQTWTLQEPHDVTSQKTTFFSHRRENVKSYIALTGWALYRRRNVSLARKMNMVQK